MLRWVRCCHTGMVVSSVLASGVPPFGATHACRAGEVERNVSNLFAHLAGAGSSSDRELPGHNDARRCRLIPQLPRRRRLLILLEAEAMRVRLILVMRG